MDSLALLEGLRDQHQIAAVRRTASTWARNSGPHPSGQWPLLQRLRRASFSQWQARNITRSSDLRRFAPAADVPFCAAPETTAAECSPRPGR